MILQIQNTKVLADLDALNSVLEPAHGEYYFILSEAKTYSYYNNQRNEDLGFWSVDFDLHIYEKASILSVDYTDVTEFYPDAIGQPLDEIKETYRKYEADGLDYNNNFRANLVLQYKTGILTAPQIYGIEAKVKNVRGLVKNGDWLTAQNAMLSIVVDSNFSQIMHDEVSDYINNYIINNY